MLSNTGCDDDFVFTDDLGLFVQFGNDLLRLKLLSRFGRMEDEGVSLLVGSTSG